MALSIVQAGVDNHVLLNAVDIKGKFKLKSVSNDILKLQKVDGSTVYDALELSFNSIDKTSILNNYNVDILQSINTKAVSNDVYNKSDIDLTCSSLVGAAPAVLNTSVKLYTALGHDSTCATTIQNQINNKSYKVNTFVQDRRRCMLIYVTICDRQASSS